MHHCRWRDRMYDVPIRLTEMDEVGVQIHAVSLPPFLFCTNADDEALATGIVAQGNDELAGYVAGAPDRLLGLGSVPLGWPGAADEARRVLDDLGLAGIAIGSQGGGKDLDDPVNDDLWALLSERGTFTFMHPSGMPAGPTAEGLLDAAAGRLPDGDGDRGRAVGVRPGAGAFPVPPVPGARRRLRAVTAWSARHGLGP